MAKQYLIVGGSTGIGLQLVKNLSSEGHSVIVLSRTKEELSGIENVTHIVHDVTAGYTPNIELDSLDGFVYCPGSINLKPFHRLKITDFEVDFQLNVLGGIRLLQQVLPALKKSEKASAVFFSTVAVQQGMGFHSSVAASKGAIEGLTRSLAAELAPSIRVNCIAPSVTDTPLASRLLSTDEKKEVSGKRHALNRVGSPSDIADMASFLLSDKSGWMTGQILGVDGGMSSIRSI
ncbi:MAG: SDR family NAD(P)-dependent oxidoreductase [Ekhidna sp.]